MAKKSKSKPNYDELFPEEEGDAVGVSTVLVMDEPMDEPKEEPKEIPKVEKPKKNPSLELYKEIENLRGSIGVAIDKGNTTSIWKAFEEVLKKYKELFL